MTTIDFAKKDDIKRLGDAVREALDKVAADFGITVKSGGGRYDPTVGTFTPKIEFAANDAGEKEFARWATILGLAPENYGQSFTSGGKTYTVAGIKPKARTRPIICDGSDGKSYVFAAETVAALLNVAAKA